MKRLCVGAALITAWVAVATPVSAAGPNVHDPGRVGPYTVGHTSLVIEDTSRTAVFNTFPGPVPVTIPGRSQSTCSTRLTHRRSPGPRLRRNTRST